MSSNIAERNRFERLSRTAVLGLAACTLLAACSQEPGAMPGDSSDDAGGNVGQADAGVGDSDDGGHDNDGGHTGGGGGGGSGGGSGHRDGLAVLTNRYDNLRTGA